MQADKVEAAQKEYKECPLVRFTGSHIAGIRSCVYCAEVYRRYNPSSSQGEQVQVSGESA